MNKLKYAERMRIGMEAVKVKMEDISVRKNTLEDVFIDITGRRLRD